MIWIGFIISIIAFEWVMKRKMDQTLKVNESIPIWNGKIILKKYYNKGIAFDRFSKYPKLIIGITSTFIIGLFAWLIVLLGTPKQLIKKFALSLLLGGAISNLLDRITKYYVMDYFSFSWKKIRHIVFNIADFCIFIGSILLFFLFLKEGKAD